MTAIFTRGFVLVTTATLVHSLAIGLISSTVALLIVQRLGLSTELIGITLGSSAIAAVLARLPMGPAIDRYGARRFGLSGPLFIATAAVLLGSAQRGQPGTPLAIQLPILVPLGAVVFGLGMSTFSTASTTYLANTIPARRRAEGLGYFGIAAGSAQGIGAGFGYSIVASGGFGALYTVAAAASIVACLTVAQLKEVRPSVASAMAQRIGFEAQVLAPTVGLFSLIVANSFALALVPLMGAERGLQNPSIFFLAAAAASIVGRLGGRIADRGRLRAIVPGMLLMTVAQIMLTQAGSTECVIVAGVTAGLGLSIAQPALQALAFDLAPQSRRGAAMATFTSALDLGVLTGTTAAGIIVAQASFDAAFIVAAASPIVGLVLLLTLLRRDATRLVISDVRGGPASPTPPL
jgi:MFS family permease